MKIEHVIIKLQEIGIALDSNGCTELEIQQLQQIQKVKRLPSLYKDFLKRIGKHASYFQQGEDFFYPAILDLKDMLVEGIEDDGIQLTIDEDIFVFWGHQGYLYHMFHVTEDNPRIYMYLEGESQLKETGDRLSDLFQGLVDEHRYYVNKKLIPDPTVGWEEMRQKGIEDIQKRSQSREDTTD